MQRLGGSGERSGLHYHHVQADLTDPAAADHVVDAALRVAGRADGVVNSVAALTSRTGFADVSDDAWRATFEVNLFSASRYHPR